MLVIGQNATDWLCAFPFAAEGISDNPASYSAAYLGRFSVIGLNRFSGHADLESFLGDWVRAGHTLIVDASGVSQSYGQGMTLFGVQAYSLRISGSRPLDWPPALAGLPEKLTFSDSGADWTGATYRGLDVTTAWLDSDGQRYPLLGYRNVGQGRVWFVGFNLFYLLRTANLQPELLRIRDYLLQDTALDRTLELPAFETHDLERDSARVSFSYHTDQPVEIVLSMTYFPRWLVEIDGRAANLDDHEHLVALSLPAGSHQVVLHYDPLRGSITQLGLLLTGISLCALVSLTWWLRRRRILAPADRAGAFSDRLPQLALSSLGAPTATVEYTTCPNCGFPKAVAGPPTDKSYPFNSIECPNCDFSVGRDVFVPVRPLSAPERPEGPSHGVERESTPAAVAGTVSKTFFAALVGGATPPHPLHPLHPLRVLGDPDQPASVAILSQDGRLIFAGGRASAINGWAIDTGQKLFSLVGHQTPIYSLALNRAGTRLASASANGTIHLWSLEQGATKSVLARHQGAVTDVAWGAGDSLVASSGRDWHIRVWDGRSGRKLAKLTGHQTDVTLIRFSPDGKMLISGDTSGAFRCWSTASWEERFSVTVPHGRALCMAFNRQTGDCIWLGAEGRLHVWHLESGVEQPVGSWRRHLAPAAAISADCRYLALLDTTVKIFDVQTCAEVASLDLDGTAVQKAAFDECGKRLAAVGKDGFVRVYLTGL
jgi:WD40 repeat protein